MIQWSTSDFVILIENPLTEIVFEETTYHIIRVLKGGITQEQKICIFGARTLIFHKYVTYVNKRRKKFVKFFFDPWLSWKWRPSWIFLDFLWNFKSLRLFYFSTNSFEIWQVGAHKLCLQMYVETFVLLCAIDFLLFFKKSMFSNFVICYFFGTFWPITQKLHKIFKISQRTFKELNSPVSCVKVSTDSD